jgi:hypothetical protein
MSGADAEWLVEENRLLGHESWCSSAMFIGGVHGEGVHQIHVTGLASCISQRTMSADFTEVGEDLTDVLLC